MAQYKKINLKRQKVHFIDPDSQVFGTYFKA